MKHLKKFNESKQEKLDVDYLTNCFVELIDEGAIHKYEERITASQNWEEFVIDIKIPMVKDEKSYPSNHYRAVGIPIEKHVENAQKRLWIFEEIENGLEKVKIKYPNLEYTIFTTTFEVSVIFTTQKILK
jgi:hypothetical protein